MPNFRVTNNPDLDQLCQNRKVRKAGQFIYEAMSLYQKLRKNIRENLQTNFIKKKIGAKIPNNLLASWTQ